MIGILLLLLLAGDVETNPGPATGIQVLVVNFIWEHKKLMYTYRNRHPVH